MNLQNSTRRYELFYKTKKIIKSPVYCTETTKDLNLHTNQRHAIMRKTFFILLSFLIQNLYAQEQNIFFSSLKIENGLSHHTVTSIYQDERGFIWIGTREGLNLYNGATVTTYKSEEDNLNSLLYNSIQKICGNRHGEIYIQGSQGVSAFNFEKEQFSTLIHDNVSTITYHDRLYIATNNKILSYENGQSSPYYELEDPHIKINVLSFINNDLWIGTKQHGLFILSGKNMKKVRIPSEVADIYQDSQKNIWVCTMGDGLYCYRKNTLERIYKQGNNAIASNNIRSCCEDNKGNLWIATSTGLNKLNINTSQFTFYGADEKPGSLNHSSITCVTNDNQGNIWIGSYFGGVNYFNPACQIYTLYKNSSTEGIGLSFPVIGKMIEDASGNLWIATEGGGVNYFDRINKRFIWYKQENNMNSLSSNKIKSLYLDEHNNILWIGTHNGLNKLELKNKRLTQFYHNEKDSNSLPSNIISDIIPYKDKLFISTHSGVCLFDPKTNQSEQFFQSKSQTEGITYATDLFIDHSSTLWIVTGELLFSYNLNDRSLKKFFDEDKSSSPNRHNVTVYIFEDSLKELWLATWGNGLYKFNREEQKFEKFVSQKDGLQSDCIYGITELEAGKLLILSNQGYSLFNTKNKEIINYSSATGLPVTGFNEYSLCKTRDNEIFLGSINGLLSFKQENSIKQEYKKIIPYRLLVNNKEVHVGDQTEILNKALYYTDKITLNASQSVFSMQFTTLNYTQQQQDIFYCLKGYSDEWINTNNFNSITYSNLPAGKYTLILSSKEGITNPSLGQTSIDIHILPPFYKSPLAIFIYITIIILAIFYLSHSHKVRNKLKQIIKYEKKRLQDNEEKTQFKLSFFTNISHEFKTPLTLIIGEIELLLQSPDQQVPDNYRKILNIYKNSLQLKQLISELLDFRKQESKQLKITVSKNNIVNFLYENYLLFKPYADKRNIEFIFKKKVNELDVWYDSKHMQKVVNNLLSNAFKYTKNHGSIKIFVNIEEDYVVFGVEDNGCGINKEDQQKIFEYFYQSSNNLTHPEATGTGIGLALSKAIIELHHGKIIIESMPEQGSRFSIYLKLGYAHFSKDEIKEDKSNFSQIIDSESINMINTNFEQHNAILENNHKLTMLIVEDNDDIRNLLCNVFVSSYKLLTASNGKEGLSLAQKEIPDIILSDVIMPELSGIQLCKKLKNDYNTCHIPIVLLTANISIKYTIEGYQTGADDYILKPFNINLLVARCNNLIKSRQLLQEKFKQSNNVVNIQSLANNDIDKNILAKAMEIIENNISNTDFTINSFAQEMGMARTNLFNKIKAITGQTPNNLILNTRLKRSATLLVENTELNISEIADSVGFSSIAYYSKCFKNMYNTSPQAYRKTHTFKGKQEFL